MAATLNMDDDLEPNLAAEPNNTPAPKKSLPERVWIVLDENDNIPPTGQYFGLNGVGYILRPGVEAYVPIGIVDILDNAVEDTPVIDPVSRKPIGWRKKRRYSYQRLSGPSSRAA